MRETLAGRMYRGRSYRRLRFFFEDLLACLVTNRFMSSFFLCALCFLFVLLVAGSRSRWAKHAAAHVTLVPSMFVREIRICRYPYSLSLRLSFRRMLSRRSVRLY